MKKFLISLVKGIVLFILAKLTILTAMAYPTAGLFFITLMVMFGYDKIFSDFLPNWDHLEKDKE
jgi:hypothetical protein